jgi:hypothetical protein
MGKFTSGRDFENWEKMSEGGNGTFKKIEPLK